MNRDSIWEAIPLFKKKLEGYRSYHQHEINIALHVIGIPDIILSLILVAITGLMAPVLVLNILCGILALALTVLLIFHFGWGGWRGMGAALLGVVFAILSWNGLVTEYFWIWLIFEGVFFSAMMALGGGFNRGVSRKHSNIALVLGVGTLLGIFSFMIFGPDLNSMSVSPWIAALALFVMGFYYHVPGHKLFEGNRPALLDDITQSFLAAPQEIIDITARSLKALRR